MSTINYAPRPSRAPLLERRLRQIVGMCRSSRTRTSVLRREISVVLANYRWGYLDQAQGVAVLDVIGSVLRGGK